MKTIIKILGMILGMFIPKDGGKKHKRKSTSQNNWWEDFWEWVLFYFALNFQGDPGRLREFENEQEKKWNQDHSPDTVGWWNYWLKTDYPGQWERENSEYLRVRGITPRFQNSEGGGNLNSVRSNRQSGLKSGTEATVTVDHDECKVGSIIRASVSPWEPPVDEYNQVRDYGVLFYIDSNSKSAVKTFGGSQWSIDLLLPPASTIIGIRANYYYEEGETTWIVESSQYETVRVWPEDDLTHEVYTRPIPDNISDGTILGNPEITGDHAAFYFNGPVPANTISYGWWFHPEHYDEFPLSADRHTFTRDYIIEIKSGIWATGFIACSPSNCNGASEVSKKLPIVINLTTNIPTMTSNTTPSGTAACSSKYGTAYDAWKAMDKTSALWVSAVASMPQWISYTFGNSCTVKGYKLKGQSYAFKDRLPMTWKFQYYNGSSWVTIDEVTSSIESDWYDGTTPRIRVFGCEPTYAAYFRLYIDSNNGGDVVSIDEFDIYV